VGEKSIHSKEEGEEGATDRKDSILQSLQENNRGKKGGRTPACMTQTRNQKKGKKEHFLSSSLLRGKKKKARVPVPERKEEKKRDLSWSGRREAFNTEKGSASSCVEGRERKNGQFM